MKKNAPTRRQTIPKDIFTWRRNKIRLCCCLFVIFTNSAAITPAFWIGGTPDLATNLIALTCTTTTVPNPPRA